MKLNPAVMVEHVWTTVGVICAVVLKAGLARTANKTLVSVYKSFHLRQRLDIPYCQDRRMEDTCGNFDVLFF